MTRIAYRPVKSCGTTFMEGMRRDATEEARAARGKFEGLSAYCLFVGYARSGSSLVGSLLDAHRAALIAHELDVLGFLGEGFDREQILGLTLANVRQFSAEGREWTGYSYDVPGQWQGRNETVRIVGDKKAGRSLRRLAQAPSLLDQLRDTMGVPVKLVHVVRNPFDNIATRDTRQNRGDLAGSADAYFELAGHMRDLRDRVGPDGFIDVRHEDVVATPAETLRRLVGFLGLDAPEEYLEACAGIVNPSPSRSRDKVEWPQGVVPSILERAAAYDFLAHYRFD